MELVVVVGVLDMRVAVKELVVAATTEVDDAGLIEELLRLIVLVRIAVGLAEVMAGLGIASVLAPKRVLRMRVRVSFILKRLQRAR